MTHGEIHRHEHLHVRKLENEGKAGRNGPIWTVDQTRPRQERGIGRHERPRMIPQCQKQTNDQMSPMRHRVLAPHPASQPAHGPRQTKEKATESLSLILSLILYLILLLVCGPATSGAIAATSGRKDLPIACDLDPDLDLGPVFTPSNHGY